MWRRFKQGYRELIEDEPGERFVNANERWRAHTQGHGMTIVIVVVGFGLILAGGFLGFVPGAPGIVLAVLGLALIGTRFRRVAIWLDWSELKLRKLWRRCRKSFASR
jgi:hypothetical protein